MGNAARIIKPTLAEILAFDRRSIRGSRGRVGTGKGVAASGPAPPSTPITIVTSLTAVLWCRDTYVEAGGAGTGVTQWTDLSPNGRHGTAAGAATPALSLSGGPNSTPLITFDGVDDILTFTTWNPPAPGTTPIFIWAVVRSVSQTSSDMFWGGQTGTTLCLIQLATAGQVRLTNGTSGPTNANMTLGTSRRVEASYTNSIADYLKVGSVSVTGTATGNTDPTGFAVGARVTANFGNVAFSEIAIWTGGVPTAGEITGLNNYASTRYGAGVLA